MAFGEVFTAVFGMGALWIIVTTLIFGLIELLGKVYATFKCLSRKDLSPEQRVIYLLLIWFIPLGWLIYLLLGREKTRELFSGVEFL